MKTKLSLGFLAMFLASEVALCQNQYVLRSEYFYSPPHRHLSVGLGVFRSELDIDFTPDEGTGRGHHYDEIEGIRVGIDYGLTPLNSAGISVDLGQRNTNSGVTGAPMESSRRYEGVGDIYFNFKGLQPLYDFSFFYSAELGVSPGQAREPHDNEKGTLSTGGTTVVGIIGFQSRASATSIFGFSLEYELKLAREIKNEDNSDSKITGGNTVTGNVFYEKNWGSFIVDVILGMGAQQGTVRDDNRVEDPDRSLTTASVSLTYKFSEMWKVNLLYSGLHIPPMRVEDAATDNAWLETILLRVVSTF